MTDIAQRVRQTFDALSLPDQVACNIARACALEPLSRKPGCVTRDYDWAPNTLEMFVAGAVSIFPAYANLAKHLQSTSSSQGMYRFFPDAVLLSKHARGGGQINLGILEFSFPIVAAHILYDPHGEQNPLSLLSKASDLLKSTSPDDVAAFLDGKRAARDITTSFRGKTYPIPKHEVSSVFDFYAKEFDRESAIGPGTGVVHNKQFVHGFPDIALAYDAFAKSKGRFSERCVDAYNAVMVKPENLGIGPGLAADFIAVTIYLALSYCKGEQFIS